MPPFINPSINPNIALRIALQGVLVMRVMRDGDREDGDREDRDREGGRDRDRGGRWGRWEEWEEREVEKPRLHWERCEMRRHP